MHHQTHGQRNPLAVKPDPAHAVEACRILNQIVNINELRASHLPNIGDLTAVTRADGINFIVEACAEQENRYYRVSAATGEDACWDDCIGWATATSLREAANRIRSAVLNAGADGGAWQ